MTNRIRKEQVKVLGIDLAKQSFQLHGQDKRGHKVLNEKLSRRKLTAYVANLPPCLIGMEACSGSNYWYRVFTEMGHTVRLMAPQLVKPFVKSNNKNDAIDAEAICEAVQRPTMRFVSPKSIEQQDIQSIHRIRNQTVKTRTKQASQIRGLLAEYGITVPKGINHLRKQIPEILEDEENSLRMVFRELLSESYEYMLYLDERIAFLEKKLEAVKEQSEDCKLLLTIPGIGLLTATALVAAIGDPSVFKNGRELAAWLGLVPQQHSTGGKPTLGRIRKRCDKYLRTLLIHGGRSVVRVAHKRKDYRSQWINKLRERRGENISAVAVANKNVRAAWAILSKKCSYVPVSA